MIARLKSLRMSERKVRLLADYIRGMDARKALDHLTSFQKAAAVPLAKMVNSALANARHNANQKEEDLFIQTITVDKAQVLKRWRARARGSAAPIHKHACHITILLGVRGETKKDGKNIKEKTKEDKKTKVTKNVKQKSVKK